VQIALLEPDPEQGARLADQLAECGHEVTRFKEGSRTLLRLRANGFKLLIARARAEGLDLDGVSLCKALREDWDESAMPVVLTLPAEAPEEAILEVLQAGANDCLLTPTSAAVLRGKIAAVRRALTAPPPRTRAFSLREESVALPASFAGYDLLEILGRGGFGAVFRARRVNDGRDVALKMLHPENNDDGLALARFFREVALLHSVEAPHLVKIVDTGFDQGRFFLATDYLPGRSGAELLEDGLSPVHDAARICAGIARGLAALHAAGVVHRDVKLANMIVDDEGQATLVDLGLAKERGDRSLTASSDIVGTAAYLSPEVVENREADAASDLYALGVCLYELVTGRKPHVAASVMGLLLKIATGEPPTPPRELRPELPAELEALILSLLEHDPSLRPRSAEEVARQLDRFSEAPSAS